LILLALGLMAGAASAIDAPTKEPAPAAATAPAAPPAPAVPRAPAETFKVGRFGDISVYRGDGVPRDVVLFVSGDGGWNLGVVSMAQRLVAAGAIVAGIDIRHYLAQLESSTEKCVSPDVDFENLSHVLQAKLGIKQYLQPTLVGYSSGATLVYATLVESPDGLFKGALSIGFCPDLDLKKPVCKGSGIEATPRRDAKGHLQGVDFLAARKLPGRWISLQGAADNANRPWFGIFLSGDGGWVGLDRGVSDELAQRGIPVVGWDSLKYFWSPRTPAGAAADLDRVLRHYAAAWGKSHAVLIGYSQGADTLPFMVNRLPAATRAMVGLTALLGISDSALFEFHVANWLGDPSGGLPTAPELSRWSGSPYVCLYGEDDGDSACVQLAGSDGSAVKMTGGHHFGGAYAEIASEILRRLPGQPSTGAP
jgi:type IV secretory pathway VirJ component